MTFILPVFFIVFRYLFLHLNKEIHNYLKGGPNGDAASYYFQIQFFRKNKCGVPDERAMITQLPMLTPHIYQTLVGRLFTDKFLLKHQWLPNFLLYSISSLFFAFILLDEKFPSQEYFFLVSVVVLFLFHPDNFLCDEDRIHFFSLQPRYLGIMINSIFWFIFITYQGSEIIYLPLIVLLIITLNISKFCIQSIILSVCVYSIISMTGEALILLIVACFFSVLFFPKSFLPGVMLQFAFLKGYYKSFYKPKETKSAFRNIVAKLFSRALLNSYVYLVIFVFFVAQYHLNEHEGAFELRLNSFNGSMFLIFIVVGIRKFAFLGECWRYLSFNYYFIFPIYGSLLLSELAIPIKAKYFILLLIIILGMTLYVISKKKLSKNKMPFLHKLIRDNCKVLKKAIWYGVPYRGPNIAVALGAGLKTFEFQYGNYSTEIKNEYFSQYPYLKWNTKIIEDHKVTHILLEKEFKFQAQKISGFSTTKLKLVDENEYYSIFKI
ncbi:hypothetical protein N8301_04390 [Cyclobacteriaceae bacterium]|nr:hypothetical protein [Cyclobacteriaceae bacterium]